MLRKHYRENLQLSRGLAAVWWQWWSDFRLFFFKLLTKVGWRYSMQKCGKTQQCYRAGPFLCGSGSSLSKIPALALRLRLQLWPFSLYN
jgi:hypothetical protein